MDNVKFEPYEIEEYLKNNAEYKITSLILANQAKTLTYGHILNYIYALKCELAGADSKINQLEEIVADQKRQINGYVSGQEVYISGYQGIQKENEQLKVEVKRLTEQSGKHVIESDHWKSMHDVLAESYTKLKNDFDNLEEKYRLYKDANNVIKEKAAKLQKENIELRSENARKDLQLQFQTVEADIANALTQKLRFFIRDVLIEADKKAEEIGDCDETERVVYFTIADYKLAELAKKFTIDLDLKDER